MESQCWENSLNQKEKCLETVGIQWKWTQESKASSFF